MNLQSILLQLNIPDFTIHKVEENDKWGNHIQRYTMYAQHKKEKCYTRMVVQLRLNNHQWEEIQLEASGVSNELNGFYFPALAYGSSSREYESVVLRKAICELEECIRTHPNFRLPLLMNEYELIIDERTLKGIKEVENNFQSSFLKNLKDVWVSFGIILTVSVLACFFPQKIAYGFVVLCSIGGVVLVLMTIGTNIQEIRQEWKIRQERKRINADSKMKK